MPERAARFLSAASRDAIGIARSTRGSEPSKSSSLITSISRRATRDDSGAFPLRSTVSFARGSTMLESWSNKSASRRLVNERQPQSPGGKHDAHDWQEKQKVRTRTRSWLGKSQSYPRTDAHETRAVRRGPVALLHVDFGDHDRVVLQLPGHLDRVTGMFGQPGKILVRDRNHFRTALGGEHILVALPRALQRAFTDVNFPAVIAAAGAVADHPRPRLWSARGRVCPGPSDER